MRKPSDRLLRTLAENVRARRAMRHWSQERLAEECDLHRTYIGGIECQRRNATLGTLEALAEALGVAVADLLTERGPTRPG